MTKSTDHFYRTRSGREVDVAVETSAGLLGVEVKNRVEVRARDGRTLAGLAEALGPEWRGGLVVYRGARLHPLRPDLGIWAMPAHRLF